MELSEFLSARVTEDEVWVRREGVAHGFQGVIGRVLAECRAKRQIMELHGKGPAAGDRWVCDEDNYSWPCHTMRALALPYADHPDYDRKWTLLGAHAR